MAPANRGRNRKTEFQGFDLAEPASPDEEETPTAPHARHPFDITENNTTAEDNASVDSQYTPDDVTLSSGTSASDSDNAEVEEQGEDTSGARVGSFLHHSNSSFSMTNAFAPPFYNRPPTPLPPSPSLTSLLRPPFSTTTSRPTTPDSSENDTPNDTESAVTRSARTATTVPRASPKVPTYEYYGFVLYLLSSLIFLLYLLWSYLPSPFLHQLGIYYYPNRWWSLAIPSFLVMTIAYIYVALASYNTGYLTLPMDSVENIVDDAANVAIVDRKGRLIRKDNPRRSNGDSLDPYRTDWKTLWNEGTDAVMDIPVGGVCEILYG